MINRKSLPRQRRGAQKAQKFQALETLGCAFSNPWNYFFQPLEKNNGLKHEQR